LDSSFNPPTLAHLALAKAPAPPPRSGGAIGEIKDESSGYDAHLLLLSIRNADKPLKPGDATHLQRLEMMFFFAQDIIQSALQSPTSTCHDGEAEPNISGIIIWKSHKSSLNLD
jgi:nicotinamide-nucleotide adenylyltransferase